MIKPTFRAGYVNSTRLRSTCSLKTRKRDPSAVLLLDMWGIGEAGIIDTLLASLSRLSGTEYRQDLLTIGGFTFAVHPPYARVADEAVEESQQYRAGGRSERWEAER